jgi:APA family basic amino acid/polyamine antiporter
LFQRVHAKFRTPHVSTIVTGSIVAIAAGVLPIGVLSVLVSMGTLLAFVLVCLGILILRRVSPEIERPFRTPGLPWVPLLGTGFCLVQMIALPVQTWVRLVVWLAMGLAIYFMYGKRHAQAVRDGRVPVVAIGPDVAA